MNLKQFPTTTCSETILTKNEPNKLTKSLKNRSIIVKGTFAFINEIWFSH